MQTLHLHKHKSPQGITTYAAISGYVFDTALIFRPGLDSRYANTPPVRA
jgi:hypothetical protein